MNKGRIIFLNGVTSSGKTSIVEALQNREDCYFYVVANDLFEQMIGDRHPICAVCTHRSKYPGGMRRSDHPGND